MIDLAYVQRMALYNRWQNANLYGVADGLPDLRINKNRYRVNPISAHASQ